MPAEVIVMYAVLGITNSRSLLLLFLAIAILPIVACSEAAQQDRVAEEPSAIDFGGVYRVVGTTVELQTGISRELTGLLVVRQEGDRYTTNFDLGTDFRAEDDDAGRERSVEVIGEGSGRVIGDVMRGSAQTQLVAAAIPGVDVRFALLPRMVGAKVISTTEAKLRPDDSIEIAIESKPAAGEDYVPTRTSLVGIRVGDVGEAPKLPAVAAER